VRWFPIQFGSRRFMQNQDTQISTSAIVSPHRGGAVLFQSPLKQALVLKRSDIDRFLIMPAAVTPLVIPSFASAGLACYTATGKVEFIEVIPNPDHPLEFRLEIKLKRSDHIAYYSRVSCAEGPVALAKRGVTVLITPRTVALVHRDGQPSLSVVASLPRAQEPDLADAYAVDPNLLRAALDEAITQAQQGIHHDN
jgi:hypothetical protein